FIVYVFFFFFFFFQAEDGIRDGHVTGVQTCALPISPFLEKGVGCLLAEKRGPGSLFSGHSREKRDPGPIFSALFRDDGRGGAVRSEERRVGKECRCRWAGEQ